eukprot:6423915-Lingulodinium_polyedra.AAC.1
MHTSTLPHPMRCQPCGMYHHLLEEELALYLIQLPQRGVDVQDLVAPSVMMQRVDYVDEGAE